MEEFDLGPPPAFAAHFAEVPDYGDLKKHFWYDWGPIFYRGRLDGSAKVLCIASDPGPTERIAGRTLVGDAGQRTQGFLNKLGLTRSYLCLNAFAFSLFPSEANEGAAVLKLPAQLAWRNKLFDMATNGDVKAIVAFGAQAASALALWSNPSGLPIFRIPHPSSREEDVLLARWRDSIIALRSLITPDPGGRLLPNYGMTFAESDYGRIPSRDLPFGVPAFLGDDSRGRALTPARRSSVSRPSPDDRHTLIWVAPKV